MPLFMQPYATGGVAYAPRYDNKASTSGVRRILRSPYATTVFALLRIGRRPRNQCCPLLWSNHIFGGRPPVQCDNGLARRRKIRPTPTQAGTCHSCRSDLLRCHPCGLIHKFGSKCKHQMHHSELFTHKPLESTQK